MNGTVDDYGRALLHMVVRHPSNGTALEVDAWVDTGFAGFLMLTTAQVAVLDLPSSADVKGALADGSQVLFRAHTCLLD